MKKIANYDHPKSLWRWVVVAAAFSFYFNTGDLVAGLQKHYKYAFENTTETKIDLSRFATFTKIAKVVFSAVSTHTLSK